MQVKKDNSDKVSLNFAIRLRGILEKKKITQKQLAEAVGVSPPAVQFWFKGKNGPSDEIKQKVADFLGVSYGWLYSGEDKNRLALSLNESQNSYVSNPRRVVLNPEFQPSKPSADVEKIDKFLELWRQEASKDADIASYLYTKLKLTLPHSDLETLKAAEDD